MRRQLPDGLGDFFRYDASQPINHEGCRNLHVYPSCPFCSSRENGGEEKSGFHKRKCVRQIHHGVRAADLERQMEDDIRKRMKLPNKELCRKLDEETVLLLRSLRIKYKE